MCARTCLCAYTHIRTYTHACTQACVDGRTHARVATQVHLERYWSNLAVGWGLSGLHVRVVCTCWGPCVRPARANGLGTCEWSARAGPGPCVRSARANGCERLWGARICMHARGPFSNAPVPPAHRSNTSHVHWPNLGPKGDDGGPSGAARLQRCARVRVRACAFACVHSCRVCVRVITCV